MDKCQRDIVNHAVEQAAGQIRALASQLTPPLNQAAQSFGAMAEAAAAAMRSRERLSAKREGEGDT